MPFAALLVELAVSYVLSRLTQPNGPRVTNLAAGAGDYGVPKPVLFGEQVRIASVVIAQDDIKEKVHKHKNGLLDTVTLGLAGALLPSSKTYTYSDTLAVLIADRTNDEPIEDLVKLWAGGKTIFNRAESDVVSETLDGDGQLVSRKYGKNKYCKSVTVYGGGFDQTADPILSSVLDTDQPGYRGSAYVVLEDLQLKDFGNAVPVPIEALVAVKTGESLASTCEKICAAANIDPITALSSTALNEQIVRGYGVTDQSTCWDAVRPLLPAFGVDAAEVAGQIRFFQRSQTIRGTIPADEMGAYAYGDQPPDKFSFERSPDLKLPKATSLTFVDPARDYQPNTAKSERSEGDAKSNVDVSLPLVLTADEGASAAALMHWDAWLGRSKAKFTLTDAWNSLETGLAYAVSIAGQFVPYRITRKVRGANGITEIEALSDESVTYTASVVGTSGTPIDPGSTLFPETRIVPIDGAILNDSEDEYGFYVALAGEPGWTEGEIDASTDGVTYVTLQISSDSAIIGDVTGTLAAGTTTGLDDTLDTTTVLTVVLIDDGMELADATDDELDAFANFCFVGKDGIGEYLQFKTATKTATATWELTDLRRGRKGSDWAIAAHASGEEFAMINDGLFRMSATTTDSWGLPLTLKGVTLGEEIADADAVAFTNTGEGKRPYSPVNVEGSWDGSYNLTITWDARSRLSVGGLGIDDQNNYEVEITSGVGRVIIATGVESATYSAANQTTDGLTPGDSIDGRVRQLSDVNDGRWRNFELIGPNTRIAYETDLAMALGLLLARSVGRADEADSALALRSPDSAPVGMATEADSALALSAAPPTSFTALRVRSLQNGTLYGVGDRTTLAEINFKASGSEISKTSTTAFEGGTGSVNGAASLAFDDNSGTSWSRTGTDGTCYAGLRGYPSAVTPDTIELISGTGTEAPKLFVVEGSTDTTNGTDGTWYGIFANTVVSWTNAETKSWSITASAPVILYGQYPAITGNDHSVGQTVTCSTGTWCYSPVSYTYQWKRNGSDLTGETSASYTIVSGDTGNVLTCEVTATNGTGSTTVAGGPIIGGETAHRYWRAKVTAVNGGGSFVAAAELEMRETAHVGNDICAGGTALADSAFAGLPATNAFDNTLSTLWACNGSGTAAYIGYDFGSGVTKNINEIVWTARDDGSYTQYPTALNLDYSDDGSSWTTKWSESSITFTQAQRQSFIP